MHTLTLIEFTLPLGLTPPLANYKRLATIIMSQLEHNKGKADEPIIYIILLLVRNINCLT